MSFCMALLGGFGEGAEIYDYISHSHILAFALVLA